MSSSRPPAGSSRRSGGRAPQAEDIILFFTLSKIVGFLIEPVSAIALLCLMALAALAAGRRRPGMALVLLAVLATALGGWTRTGALLLSPLEERFARPPAAPGTVDGIIVLGGGFEGAVNLARGGADIRDSGDRYVEALALAREHPDARIVVTGGTGALVTAGEPDTATAARLFARFGVDPARLILEGESRNTAENAAFTRALVDPKPGETWLLVTSAFHMPRSVGLFRAADFPVVPWPVDYRTPGPGGGFFGGSPASNMSDLSLALREWVGLVAYRLTGRTADLFPRP